MKKQETAWYCLALLTVLAGCGLGVVARAGDDKQDVPKPLPAEVVQAWRDAGADLGWMKDTPPRPTAGYEYWEPFREKVQPGAIPAFRFHPEKEGVLVKLPDPGVPFGLDTHCSAITDTELKELAGLKSLQSLNIGGSLVLTDTGLKELAALKNLRGLYLFYTHVTDEGLKELARLKNLQALDLSHTQVTDFGLQELVGLKNLQALNLRDTQVADGGLKVLAGVKSLRWLNLRRTQVTAAGVIALENELPDCRVVAGND